MNQKWMAYVTALMLAATNTALMQEEAVPAQEAETASPAVMITAAPPTEAPATQVPATQVPVTAAPVTQAPATAVPQTGDPKAEEEKSEETQTPAVQDAADEAAAEAATQAPQTEVPAISTPATAAPQTAVPQTAAPVAQAPALTPKAVKVERLYGQASARKVHRGSSVTLDLVLGLANENGPLEDFYVAVDVSRVAVQSVSHGGAMLSESGKDGRILLYVKNAQAVNGEVVSQQGNRLRLTVTLVPFAEQAGEQTEVSFSLLNSGMGDVTPANRGTGSSRVQRGVTFRLAEEATEETEATQAAEQPLDEAAGAADAAQANIEETPGDPAQQPRKALNSEAAAQDPASASRAAEQAVTEEKAEATETVETTENIETTENTEATETTETAENIETTENTEAANEQAAAEQAEVQATVARSARIEQSIPQEDIRLGDVLTLTAVLEGFDDVEAIVIWQVDDGTGYRDVEGAVGNTLTVAVNEANAGHAYRFVVKTAE